MRNCREITELVSKSFDKKLNVSEQFAIRLHVMLCSRCRNFRNQTRFIRRAAQHYMDQLKNRSGKNS